jgi:hypothetical protein
MTEPVPSLPPMDPTNSVIWCVRCAVHYALTHQPLCPVCLPTAAEEAKA